MGETVAVVGASGFLGRNIVLALAEAGHKPVAVARQPDRVGKGLPQLDLEVRQADISDVDALQRALAGCDIVFNAVAVAAQVYTMLDHDFAGANTVNVLGSQNLLKAAHAAGARRVVITGTCTARYEGAGRPVTESSPPPPVAVLDDPYVRSKLQEEKLAGEFAERTGLEVVTTLPAGLVGPHDSGPSVQGGALVLDHANFRPSSQVTIDGWFPVVDVRDAARGAVLAMTKGKPGQSYLTVAKTVSIREWNDVLFGEADLPRPRLFIPERMAMSMAGLAEKMAARNGTAPQFTKNMVRQLTLNQRYDCSLAKTELGLSFRPIEETVRDTLHWFCDQGYVEHPERLTFKRQRA